MWNFFFYSCFILKYVCWTNLAIFYATFKVQKLFFRFENHGQRRGDPCIPTWVFIKLFFFYDDKSPFLCWYLLISFAFSQLYLCMLLLYLLQSHLKYFPILSFYSLAWLASAAVSRASFIMQLFFRYTISSLLRLSCPCQPFLFLSQLFPALADVSLVCS